jgi:predicted transposase YbfD/YdcC
MCFCLLLTEFSGCRLQRKRARWLKLNWHWIREQAIVAGIENVPINAPSQPTISRFCTAFDEHALKQSYLKELRKRMQSEASYPPVPLAPLPHYSIDGKARSGCVSPTTGRTEMDLVLMDVSTRTAIAWMVLPDKEGEATQARKLMAMYGREVPRGVVTADAGITGPRTVRETRRAGHEYIFAIKGNAGRVHEEVTSFDWNRCALEAETNGKGHGRIEHRKAQFLPVSAFPRGTFSKYHDCGYVIRIEAKRVIRSEISVEVRYFIASKGLKGFKAEDFLRYIRAHWIQEDGYHWVKDAILGEDDTPRQSRKGSRLLGFLKSIVVSVGFALYESVREFVDDFSSGPEMMTDRLLYLSIRI